MAKETSEAARAAQELKKALEVKSIWKTDDGQYFTDYERAVNWAQKTKQTITKY